MFCCGICGNEEGNEGFTALELMYGWKDELPYFQCAACSCIQIAEVPDDLDRFYPPRYHDLSSVSRRLSGLSGRLRSLRYRIALFPKGPVERLAGSSFSVRRRIGCLSPLSFDTNTRVLDIGCGNGSGFLWCLAGAGMTRLCGCDPFISHDVRYDNGLELRKCGIEEMEGEWDIISFHHSFEHVPDPLNVLQAAERLLARRGVCVVRVPTVPCWAWEHYGTNWVQLDAPRHLFVHSPDSMAILAANSGLEVFNTVYDSTRFQFSGSEKLARGTPLRQREALNRAAAPTRLWEKWDHGRRAARLNREARGDQAVFYLRRNNSAAS